MISSFNVTVIFTSSSSFFFIFALSFFLFIFSDLREVMFFSFCIFAASTFSVYLVMLHLQCFSVMYCCYLTPNNFVLSKTKEKISRFFLPFFLNWFQTFLLQINQCLMLSSSLCFSSLQTSFAYISFSFHS